MRCRIGVGVGREERHEEGNTRGGTPPDTEGLVGEAAIPITCRGDHPAHPNIVGIDVQVVDPEDRGTRPLPLQHL